MIAHVSQRQSQVVQVENTPRRSHRNVRLVKSPDAAQKSAGLTIRSPLQLRQGDELTPASKKQRGGRRKGLESSPEEHTILNTGLLQYDLHDKFPDYAIPDRCILCSCAGSVEQPTEREDGRVVMRRKRMVTNLDYWCEHHTKRHLIAKNCAIHLQVFSPVCGWEVKRVPGNGDCLFQSIRSAVLDTLEYLSEAEQRTAVQMVPSTETMRGWWADRISRDTFTIRLEGIKASPTKSLLGYKPLFTLYQAWLGERKRSNSAVVQSKGQQKKKRSKTSAAPDITVRSEIPTGQDLDNLLKIYQDFVKKPAFSNSLDGDIVWGDEECISVIAER